MKTKFLFSLLLGGILLGGVACTDNGTGEVTDSQKQAVAKKPDFLAYSGGNTLLSTFKKNAKRTAVVNANEYDKNWDCVPNVNLTSDELEELKDLFCILKPVENTIIFPFENYWVQQVYKGEATYTPTDIYGNECNGSIITGSDHMDKLVAHNLQTEYKQVWEEWNNWSGSWEYVTTEYEHVNNFNNGNNTDAPGTCGCGIQHKGTTLMVDMSLEGVTPNNQFGFHESHGTSHNYNNYIMIQYKGEWYVGFDYEMHKNEAQNPNEAKDVERDYCFTDWIVKITPAYHKGETPETPWTPDVDEPTPDDDDDNATNDPIEGYDEVEINLSINAEKTVDDYISTKLSMHLRSATDIEVFIPVPEAYYCDRDDMNIVLKHDEYWVYGETLEVADQIVSLNVEFQNGGIRIWTDGMNQEILDYCIATYNDGLTFEVWNYFNETVTREMLKPYLDQATVRFLDKNPSAYINAFMYDYDEEGNPIYDRKFPLDCTVDIIDEQKNSFNDPQTGWHYNGSEFNEIYTQK